MLSIKTLKRFLSITQMVISLRVRRPNYLILVCLEIYAEELKQIQNIKF